MASILVCTVFIFWFLFSIWVQFNKLKNSSNILTKLLLPEWRFFSPEPLSNDMVLYYRDKTEVFLTTWKLGIPEMETKWYNVIFNPKRRIRKTVIDATKVISINFEKDRDNIHTTIPYLVILFYVSNLNREYISKATQFAIISTSFDSKEKSKLLFSSSFHEL